MTDIVERLRADVDSMDAARLLDEAADEIEALRGDLLTGNSELLDQAEIENKRLRRSLDRSVGQANDYRAEAQRLRGALEKIAHPPDDIDAPYYPVSIARAALGDGKHTACKCEPGYTDPMCPEVE